MPDGALPFASSRFIITASPVTVIAPILCQRENDFLFLFRRDRETGLFIIDGRRLAAMDL
jgi:hypothetical protein